MANDAYTQQYLAQDGSFHGRVRAALATVAWQVLEEDAATHGHDMRAGFARQVIGNLTQQAQTIAPWLVERPNLFSFATSFDFQRGNTITAAGDLDIQAQLMADWDDLAG